MQSPLFDQANLEVQAQQRFALQNPQMLRVHLGGDVLAVKGAMVSYQGQIRFDHEKAGSVGKLFKKVVTGEDVSLMRVSGEGDVFFASEAGFVFLIELTGDALSVNARNLLAFDSTIDWDIKRVQGAGHAERRPVQHHAAGHRHRRDPHGRTAGDPRLQPAAHLRRRAGLRRLVGQPGARRWCRA